MAITIPSKYTVITTQTLMRVLAGREPLESMLDNTNWLYAQHRPAIANVCPFKGGDPDVYAYMPIMPSADGLDYDLHAHYWAASASPTLSLETSANGTSWTSRSSATESGGGEAWITPRTITIPATELYARVRLVGAGATNVQIHNVVLLPTAITSIAAGAKPSGFVPFEDTGIATTGAPIHTEYLNRAWSNVAAVLRDRRQVLASFCQPTNDFDRFTADETTEFARWYYYMPGQQAPTVTARIWAVDAGGSAEVTIKQAGSGGGGVAFTCTGTVRDTATMQLNGDRGEIVARITPGTGSTCDIYYVTLDWRPGD